MPTLKAVHIQNKVIGSEIAHVAKIPIKKPLFWNDPNLTDAELEPLASCVQLEEVGVRDLSKITHRTLEILLQLPHLTSLSVEGCQRLTWNESGRLKEACNLQRLVVKTCPDTDQFLKFLPHCPSLSSVHLTNCEKLSDRGLALLGNCKQLTDLEICQGNRKMTDEGLLLLTQCPIRYLRLKMPPSTDQQMNRELKAWKNISIIGVRKFVERAPQLRLFGSFSSQSCDLL